MMRILMTFFLIMPEKLSNFKVLVLDDAAGLAFRRITIQASSAASGDG